MSELTAHHLCDNGAQELIIINRTPLHAIDLAKRLGLNIDLLRNVPGL